MRDEVERLLRAYPRIFMACHVRHVRDETTGEVLSQRQASVLDHLDEREGMALKDLAAHMGVTPSSMCLMADRLERMGYLRRKADAGDKRRVSLVLTPAGVAMQKRQKVLEPKLIERMLRQMGQQERERALKGLELLAAAAEKVMGQGGWE